MSKNALATLERPAAGASPALHPGTAALRQAALEQHWPPSQLFTLLDARSWSEHTPDEEWLIWRARWSAGRLRGMPLEVLPDERLAGRPAFRDLPAEEREEAERLWKSLPPNPGYPGGDCGHFQPDYEKLLRLGVGGVLDEVRTRRGATEDHDRRVFYDACELALQGFSDYVRRVAGACADAGKPDLARICERVATEPPATFHEAIELIFLALIAFWFAEDHGLTCPGRLDRTLWPLYEADIAEGRITREDALDLICHLFIELNLIVGPGLAIAVLVGGTDGEGRDVTNELTYLCLEAREATALCYPTVGVCWHRDTPPELIDFGCRMAARGCGDPAFFNEEVIGAGLRDHGVSAADSCNFMNSTCVEIKPVGAANIWVASPYFNCPQALLEVIDDIVDGRADDPGGVAGLVALVRENLAAKVKRTAEDLDRVWRKREEIGGFPLASCFIGDCLERGQDFDRGGARYHWVENSFVGLANLADSLVSIDRLIYKSRELTFAKLREVLRADFAGHEELRSRIVNQLPRYGNDNDEVDALAVQWAGIVQDISESNTIGGHCYVPGFFCWIMHGELGKQTGATPDGRRAGAAFADGAGAAQGRDTSGPTASVLSTTKWSHRRALGGLVHNVKFTKSVLQNEPGIAALRTLVETYLQRGGFEVQVNVVNAETLRAAQEHPEDYRDLLVRVAGYSDYFTHLARHLQDEVIARTEHGR